MIRETSIEAYKNLVLSGLLSERRREVYQTVYKFGPMTSGEAFSYINRNRPIGNLTQSRARFTELREMGLLKEMGTRICSVSGMTTILWDVTSRVSPITIPKNKKPEEPERNEPLIKFAELVREMRGFQNAYFRSRDPKHLETSKRLEKEVDNNIDAILKTQLSMF